MRRTVVLSIVILVAILSLPLLAGCGSQPLLTDVAIRPAVISPNADGVDDVAEIRYTLTRQATFSLILVDSEGGEHYFRRDLRRSRGERTAYFGGVIEGSLLPDGDYTSVFVATDDRGHQERVELPITIRDGDDVAMRIEKLDIFPQTFTPNRDGIADRVRISYVLNKRAARVDVYLLGNDGTRFPVPEDRIREMGAPGTHEHDYDAGVDLGAPPPPDGVYTVVVEAEDAVGTKDRIEGKLEIRGGGVPMVEIVNRAAQFSPDVVPLGGTLTFTTTVRNIGTVPVRTKGPESGSTYTTSENFNTLGEYEEPGIFRVGLDYEGNSAGRTYPFRWQLGTDDELTQIDTDIGPENYLMPGQTVTVVGHLRIVDQPVKPQPYFWLGLIHEQVWIVQDRVEPLPIPVAY